MSVRLLLEASLCGPCLFYPWLFHCRHIKCFSERFKQRLRLVMIVDTIQNLQVDIHHCAVRNCVKEFPYHLSIHLTHLI